MRPALRWALALAASGTLAVSWLPDEPDVVVASASSHAAPVPGATPAPRPLVAAAATAPVPASSAVSPVLRGSWPSLSGAARSAWLPAAAPPPPPPAAPASVPEAPPPPFPYQWIGQVEEDGSTRIFLAGPQRLWVVVPGEVLDERWRVEGIDAGRLQLTWLATGAGITVAARP